MSKSKSWVITLAVVGVAAAYCYIYRDWFRPPTIAIYHRVATARPNWQRRNTPPPATPAAPSIVFGFDRKVQLTRVQVFKTAEITTNAAAMPIWHLTSQSNSVPLKGFMYADRIRGMQPFVKGGRALPLESNVTYRLLIEAGSKKGQHDFSLNKTDEAAPPSAQ